MTDLKAIKDLIIGAEKVSLKDLVPFQPENFKFLARDNYEKLRNSLIRKNFVAIFHVFKHKGVYKILDGHHRKRVLEDLQKEGYEIPDKFLCAIVDVKDEKHAAEILPTFSAEFARMDPEGFYEFAVTHELDFSEMKETLDIRGIDFDRLGEDAWSTDLNLAEKHGEHTDGIKGKVTIRCEQESVDAIKSLIEKTLKEKGFSDAEVS